MNIQEIISIAKKAGKAILEIYNQDFDHISKESNTFENGTSPLTKADLTSHQIINKSLTALYPNIPILSEEGKNIPFETRKNWTKFWLIDPLDGTKEFIKKNGEFTVNIALIENHQPILGVVYVPAKGTIYYADNNGSFKQTEGNDPIKLPIAQKHEKLQVVASTSHFNDATKNYIASLGKSYDLVNAGSSLKLCLVAEGAADLYPRLGPTMEWDTAAAHAIVKFAGKTIIDYHTKEELSYNKENLLNPFFVVQ